MVISGYAALYETRSQDLGGWSEVITAGAFRDVLKSGPDVVALFNHNPDNILARTTAKTLKLREDKTGLYMEAELGDDELSRRVYSQIARGDVRGQSFAFVAGSDTTWNDDYTERRVNSVAGLYDVGPVVYPAYSDTTVAARSREAAMKEREAAERTNSTEQKPKQEPNTKGKPMNWKELQARSAEKLAEATKIKDTADAEKRELTPEEVESVETFLAESEADERQAAALKSVEERTKKIVQPEPRQVPPQVPAPQPKPVHVYGNTTRMNLRHYTPQLFGGSWQVANEAAYRTGMWLAGALFNHNESRQWCESNGMEFRAMAGKINAAGGYLVPEEMERAVINAIDQYGVARRLCRVHRMTSDVLVVPIRSAGLTATPVGENEEATETDKTWANAELVARKWMTLTRYSSEIAEDAIIDMADDLTREIASAFAGTEDDCFFNGSGAGSYHGIRGIWYLLENSGYTGCVLDAASGVDTLAEVTVADLSQLIGKLPDKYRAGATWVCNPLTKAAVFDRLFTVQGGGPGTELAGAPTNNYMGYPIVTSEKMYAPATPSTASNDKCPIMFGNFSFGCSFGDRRMMAVRTSDQRYFEYDQLAIRGTTRFDISCHNAACGTSAGPVLGLLLTT